MKFARVFFLLVALCVCGHAAEDQLFGMTPEMSKLIAPYIEKAKATFPAVKKKYIAGDYVREKRVLDVQINLVDKDGTKEMVFVFVTQCLGDRFQGIVTNEIQLLKEYKKGDEVSFTQDQIRNWVVVDSLGNEEGNFVGKAIEAFDSGIVGVFFEGVFGEHAAVEVGDAAEVGGVPVGGAVGGGGVEAFAEEAED